MPFDNEDEQWAADSRRWNKIMDQDKKWDAFHAIVEVLKVALLTWIALEVAL